MLTRTPLSLTSCVVRNPTIFMSEIDDELVCFDEPSGNYYGLNETGKKIWEMMREPISVQTIVDTLAKQYPDVSTIKDDVMKYLNELYLSSVHNQLIHVA